MVLAACMITVIGCGSGHVATILTPEERFQQAKALYDDEDYLEAINEFRIITLQHPGSEFADDAQFYLGECRFQRGEYLLATHEYGELKRNMPASSLVPDGQFKLGLSYYHLAPKPSLDQQSTKKAIDELQTFVEYYPSHQQASSAEAKIQELNTRLAEKSYETARLYSKMEDYKAAIFYFDDVIEKFHDTKFAPLAYLGKVEALIARKKYDEADSELNKFISLFPNSVLRNEADRLKQKVSGEMDRARQMSGERSGRRQGPGSDPGVSSSVRP